VQRLRQKAKTIRAKKSVLETWVIEVQSRIPVGIALGWSFFDKDENHDYGELIIYLALISLHLKWQ
jgi:hypothetical protein